ncbi:MAG TPA: carboxypeptidase-like regulatory domain-containing protein [Vicinamibacterales bacterium]|nr:carboxypeptidase-like regulatory domain-containing protein [Vicinamibacterales bacterium]
MPTRARVRVAALAAAIVCSCGSAHAAQVPPPPPPPPPPPMGAGAAPQDPGASRTGTGVILGKVIDAGTGSPIGGAIVTMVSRPGNATSAEAEAERQAALAAAGLVPSTGPSSERIVTDSDGRFVLRDLPAGPLSISSQASGYLPGGFGRQRPDGPSRPVALENGERRTDVIIRMWKYAVIAGTVVDEVGDLAVGIGVRLVRISRTGGARRLTSGAFIYTDDRGRFRFPFISPGEYLVAVPSATVTVPISNVAAFYQQLAAGNSSAMLREQMASGAPTASAGGLRVGDQLLQTPSIIGRSLAPPPLAADGRLRAYRTVYFPAAATAAEATVIRLASGETRDDVALQLRLESTVTVSGEVMGPDGPVANIGVKLLPAGSEELTSDTGFETATTATDAAGRFVLLGVAPGSYTARVLRVPRPGGPVDISQMTMVGGSLVTPPSMPPPGAPVEPVWWAAQPLSVGESDIANVNLTLREGAKLSGRIVFEGAAEKPGPDRLRVIGISLGATAGTSVPTVPARPDAEGRFTTMGYPPGRYFVNASAVAPQWTVKSVMVDGRDASADPIDLEGSDITGVVITYTDKPTTIAGTVTGSGRGDVDAVVIVIPADYRRWMDAGMSTRRTRQVSANRTGAYTLPNLPAGEYLIAAFDAGVAINLEDPQFIAELVRVATPIRLADGERREQPLKINGGGK